MHRKLMTILKIIAQEIIENGVSMDDVLKNMKISEIDLIGLQNDIMDLEESEAISDEELDLLKAFITYIMVKDTHMEREDIYSIVFGKGRRITWQ